MKQQINIVRQYTIRNYSIREVKNYQEFINLKPIWNTLLSKSENNTFFLTHEWIDNWWQCFGKDNQMYILTAINNEKDNDIVGIAPLMITKNKKIQFIGTPLADYGDFIVKSNLEEKKNVLTTFLEHLLKNNKKWKSISFDEIQERSSTIPMLRILLSENAPDKFLIKESIQCMGLDFQKSTNKELAKLLKKKTIRRHIKYLQSQGEFIFKKIEEIDEANRALETFFAQHIAIWDKKKDPSMFLNEQSKRFFKQLTMNLLEKGTVAIWAIYLNDKLLAMQFGFEHNESYITYCQSQDLSFAKHSPGTILYKYFIEEYKKNSMQMVDHSRGTESYKYRFSNDTWKNMKVVIHNNALNCLANKAYVTTRKRLRVIKKIIMPAPNMQNIQKENSLKDLKG